MSRLHIEKHNLRERQCPCTFPPLFPTTHSFLFAQSLHWDTCMLTAFYLTFFLHLPCLSRTTFFTSVLFLLPMSSSVTFCFTLSLSLLSLHVVSAVSDDMAFYCPSCLWCECRCMLCAVTWSRYALTVCFCTVCQRVCVCV